MSDKSQSTESSKETRVFSMEQIAAALFAAHQIDSGLWRVGCHLRFAGLTMSWEEQASKVVEDAPTGMIGIFGIGLTPVEEPGPLVFDAAQLSKPAAKPAAKKRAAAPSRAIKKASA